MQPLKKKEKKKTRTLTGVAQRARCHPEQPGRIQEATDECFSHTLMFASLFFSPSTPLSKNK